MKQQLKEKLQQLESKLETYKDIIDGFAFKTQREADDYKIKYKNELADANRIRREIEKVKWELMTDEEKMESIKMDISLRQKYKEDDRA